MKERRPHCSACHDAGFSNPQLISMCDLLGTMGKDKLKHLSIGPPRDPTVTAEGCQLQSVPFSDECLAAIASMLKSLTSVDLVVIHGLSPEQTEALSAAVPSGLHSNTSDGCLRLSSASRCSPTGHRSTQRAVLPQPRVQGKEWQVNTYRPEHSMLI